MTLLCFNSSTELCNPYHIADHCATVGFTITLVIMMGFIFRLFGLTWLLLAMNHKQNEINSLLHIGKT